MPEKPRVAVLSGFGINCETETMAVFDMAGASSDRVHVNRLVNAEQTLSDYDIMAIPGGFSFGDHLGSGRLLGNRLRFGLREQVRDFVKAGKPVIGICNGFQVLVKMGLLPGDEDVSLTQTASLSLNDSGHYEDRWVTLEFDPKSTCIWTNGIERIRVPVRHGEGKFVTDDMEMMERWDQRGQLAVRYVDPDTDYPSLVDDVLPYPISPNQSWMNIAGVCDPSGLVFGLMPHPEANHSTWLGATWTREDIEHGEGEGMAIFRNAVDYVLSRK